MLVTRPMMATRPWATKPVMTARKRQHEPARVIAGAPTRHESRFDEPRDDCRHRALIGVRSLGQFAEGDVRRAADLRQNEELRRGDAGALLRGTIAHAQLAHQTTDGVEHTLSLAHQDKRYRWAPNYFNMTKGRVR